MDTMQPSNVVAMKDALPSDAAARQRLHQLLDAYLDADLAILLTRIRETEGAGSFTFAVTLGFDARGELKAKSRGKTSLPPVVEEFQADISSSGALTLF